jgi:hypothetical protein
LNLNSLSFLAADVASEAFNHSAPPGNDAMASVALNADEVEELAIEIETLMVECHAEMESGFIRESAEKLRRIALHFSAHLGQIPPVAPRCNAPWVSAVIESDGAVRPCFFHRPIGSLHDGPLVDVLNSDAGVQFRTHLDISRDAICQRCVCSLFMERGNSGRMSLGGAQCSNGDTGGRGGARSVGQNVASAPPRRHPWARTNCR